MLPLKLAVLVALLAAVTGARRKGPCSAEVFQYHNNHLGCHDCDPCPPGEAPIIQQEDIKWDQDKGALTCYRCGPCEPGTYKENRNHNECTRCLPCKRLARHTVKNCSSDQNTQCGTCIPGFHDRYLAQQGHNDTRKPCQPCHMAMDAPECARSTAPTVKRTILAEILTPVAFHNKSGKNGNVYKDVIDPHSSHKGETDSNWIIALGICCAILVLVCVCVILVWKCEQHGFCRRTSHQQNRPRTWNGDLVYKPTTVNDDYENLSSAASSANSLQYPNHCGKKLKSKLCQAISPQKKKTKRLSENVVEDSASCKPLLTERRKQEVCPADFRIIQNEIGNNWKDLARRLKITDPDIELLESDYSQTKERIYQMLVLFQKANGANAILNTLCEALEAINRKDIVAILLKDHSPL